MSQETHSADHSHDLDHDSHSGHSHGHSHGHGHHHAIDPTNLGDVKKLIFVFFLIAIYAAAEAVGGYLSGSLALLADAGHMVSDVFALGIALGAIWLSRRPATKERTYGLYRAEVLGALINAVALIVIALIIFKEAWGRFSQPPEVLGGIMLAVAIGGLIVNLTGVLLLHSGQNHSLNIRGAWLHMVADTLGSVGAIISAILIWQFDWRLADPLASVLIGCLILWSSLSLLKETVDVLMESAPSRLDVGQIETALVSAEGVLSVHDLHAWTIGSGREALTAHIVVDGDAQAILVRLRQLLKDSFGLNHVTLQVESEEGDCCNCSFDDQG